MQKESEFDYKLDFNHKDRIQHRNKSILLLSAGTFLEYFDLYLYAHMSGILSSLFFPESSIFAKKLSVVFGVASGYFFRPVGAVILGYIGDKIGRKHVIVATIFMMATSSLTIACLPTYASIGFIAPLIMILCRIIQSISSMGEFVGGSLYIMEIHNQTESKATAGVSFLVFCCHAGSLFALFVGSLVTSSFPEFGWRLAFLFGTIIGLIGTSARKALVESSEFADAKRRVLSSVQSMNFLVREKHPMLNSRINWKCFFACMCVNLAWPVAVTFVLVYCSNILKEEYGYTNIQVMYNNVVPVVVSIFWYLTATYICYKGFSALKISKIRLYAFVPFVILMPILLNYIKSPYTVLACQVITYLISPSSSPAEPIFFKNIPIFQRFRMYGIAFGLTRMVMYTLPVVILLLLQKYLMHWAITIVFISVLIPFAWGLNYFDQLESKRKSLDEAI